MRDAVLATPAYVAVIWAGVEAATDEVTTLKLALLAPAGIVIVAGTFTAAKGVADKPMTAPPVGADPEIFKVPPTVADPVTVELATVIPARVGPDVCTKISALACVAP